MKLKITPGSNVRNWEQFYRIHSTKFAWDRQRCGTGIRFNPESNKSVTMVRPGSQNGREGMVVAKTGFSRGVHYWEICVEHTVGMNIGICTDDWIPAYFSCAEGKVRSNSWELDDSVPIKKGDIVGVQFNAEEGVTFYVNGTTRGTYSLSSDSTFYPMMNLYSCGARATLLMYEDRSSLFKSKPKESSERNGWW